ncbi:hypothetical protein UlMin_015886 [Ulmus minor]
MTGIDPEVAVHRLQVDPEYRPIKQKRRKFASERNKIINDEIQKLIDVGSVREVQYPEWLANVVVVQKKNRKWRKFLGYVVTQRGIKANPEQIKSILNLASPTCRKDVQKLTGRIAALSRFISRSSERCHNFFNILKKNTDFIWTEECEEALQELKSYLTSAPLLSKPQDGEMLFLYLAVSEHSVSAVLLEKLALALITAARKLRPYFQNHLVTVLTSFPLKNILHKPELSGRLTKWAVELSEHHIDFQPRTAIKSQVLADFIADFSPNILVQAEKELMTLKEGTNRGTWILNVDGSSNFRGSGLGLVLASPNGDKIEQSIRCGFLATNNEAEYEALIAGLSLAREMGVEQIKILSDSQLVVNQINGKFNIDQIPRDENSHADALANLGSAVEVTKSQTIPIIYLKWPVIWKQDQEAACEIDIETTWMTPIFDYLQNDILPNDKDTARKIKATSARFTIIQGNLFRRSFSGPYLTCIKPSQVKTIMSEIHEGECGNHSGPRSLAHKIITTGYYWPTLRADCKEFTKKCDKCQ